MPELQWDEFDFFYCLEVEPQFYDEYKLRYIYKVEKEGLALTVVVRPLDGAIFLSLGQRGSELSLVEFAVLVRGKIRYIRDKRGEYLEFDDCLLMPTTMSHYRLMRPPAKQADAMDAFQPGWTVQLSIKPQIQIRYLD